MARKTSVVTVPGDFILTVFVREVVWQCKFVRFAADDVEASLAADDRDRCWFALLGLLTAAANISKLLWGSHPRRADLRALLGVEDDSPLRVRKLRNDLEHFDERLDEWAAAGAGS